MFESVYRRTDARRLDWYTISSPYAFGSGELISICLEDRNVFARFDETPSMTF